MIARLLAVAFILFAASGALAHPGSGIVLGADGRIFFVDTGAGVFELGRDGKLTSLDRSRFHWLTIDPSSRFARTTFPAIPGAEIRSVGVNPTLIISSDFPVTIGRDGALYYPELEDEKRWSLIRVTPSGSRSVFAALPMERRPDGSVSWINGIATAADGSLYYAHDKVVRKVSDRGIVSTFATNVTVPNCVAIPGIEPQVQPYLRGLDVAPDGSVTVAAAGCGAVVKITAAGRVTPILRTVSPHSPTAVALSNGEVYVQEYLHTVEENRSAWVPRIRKITRSGAVETLVTVTRQGK